MIWYDIDISSELIAPSVSVLFKSANWFVFMFVGFIHSAPKDRNEADIMQCEPLSRYVSFDPRTPDSLSLNEYSTPDSEPPKNVKYEFDFLK